VGWLGGVGVGERLAVADGFAFALDRVGEECPGFAER
jgi:hypothetical protein